jgi:hypothetical protein
VGEELAAKIDCVWKARGKHRHSLPGNQALPISGSQSNRLAVEKKATLS